MCQFVLHLIDLIGPPAWALIGLIFQPVKGKEFKRENGLKLS
mgnify:CR=1 FL=1